MKVYFKPDNTEGITQDELDNFNFIANTLLDDDDDYEKVQAVTEKILKEYEWSI